MMLLIILFVLFMLYVWYDPMLDRTRDGKVLLWYGHRKRKYIVLKE